MTTTNKKKVTVTVDQLNVKHPTFASEISKYWRKIVRYALSEQVARNPNSRCLRGIKEMVITHFPINLENDELYVVVNMISNRFNRSKNSPEWDEWRPDLPNIFPEKIAGNISWLEDDNGIPESMAMIEEDKKKTNDGCAVIIIQDGNFKAEYTNVPSDVALTINAELSKALS